MSRPNNWCHNILLPISNRRKPKKTVDSRNKRGFGEKFLYINISQGILRPCLRNRKVILIEELQEGSLDTVRTFICSIGRLHRKQRDAAMN